MANIYSDNAQKQNELPNLISFLEMMKVGRVEQLTVLPVGESTTLRSQ
jgi:hypothetical protein